MAVELMESSSLDNSFESRSKKESPETEEMVKPLINKDKIVTTKKSFVSKVKDSFFSEDAKDIGDYILNDILIPGIKDTVLSTIERAFGYDSYDRRRSSDKRRYDDDRPSYASYYRSSRDSRDRKKRLEHDEKIDYRNVVLRDRADAENIVHKMRFYIHEYDSVSVAMLFDLIDMPGKYTDNNWGWTRESDICVRRVRNGYLIDVPEAEWIGD